MQIGPSNQNDNGKNKVQKILKMGILKIYIYKYI